MEFTISFLAAFGFYLRMPNAASSAHAFTSYTMNMPARWIWQFMAVSRLLTTFSNAIPLVHAAISNTCSTQQHVQDPSSHHPPKAPVIEHDPSPAQLANDLRHRDIADSFNFTGLFLPIRTSAFLLAKLYQQTLHACLSDWQSRPEISTMILRLGDLQLTIVSEGGTIPWNLVASFAASWLVHTNRGMVSTYRAVYAAPDLMHGVQFHLEIVGQMVAPCDEMSGHFFYCVIRENVVKIIAQRGNLQNLNTSGQTVKRKKVAIVKASIFSTVAISSDMHSW